MKKSILFLFTVALSLGMSAQSSPKEESKELATRFFTEVWNPPFRLETIDELVSEDFKLTTDENSISGRENFKKWVVEIQKVVGDLKNTPQEMLITDDGKRVITRIHATGTNKGMFGTEPDGAPIRFTVISILEIKNGKITRNWVERSAFELYKRLTVPKEKINKD